MREGKKSNESQTLQTQTKIYETETIKHGGVLHGDDDKSSEEITSVSTPTPPTVNVSQPLASASSKSWRWIQTLRFRS